VKIFEFTSRSLFTLTLCHTNRLLHKHQLVFSKFGDLVGQYYVCLYIYAICHTSSTRMNRIKLIFKTFKTHLFFFKIGTSIKSYDPQNLTPKRPSRNSETKSFFGYEENPFI